MLLDSENKKLLDYQRKLQQDQRNKKDKLKTASDFNKAQMERLAEMRQKFQQIRSIPHSPNEKASFSDQTRFSVAANEEAWRTTQRESFHKHELPDLTINRQNYKKKTPFT